MPAKKKVKFAEDPEEEEVVEVWDFRKIAIGIVFLLFLIFLGVVIKRILFHESLEPASFVPKPPTMESIASYFKPKDDNHKKFSIPTQQDVQNQIQQIQQQVTHLNVNDVATASPQVQKLLKQIQEIPAGPVGQVKQACVRLCNNL